MNKTVLNIGLGPSLQMTEGTPIGFALETVMRSFKSAYIEFRSAATTPELGEDTLVVIIPDEAVSGARLTRLSEILGQDCLASVRTVHPEYGSGPAIEVVDLFGPRAHHWGTFDASKFLQPSRNPF